MEQEFENKDASLFSAIMWRYEEISYDIAILAQRMNYAPKQRHLHTHCIRLKHRIVDFVNFISFHPKIYAQIEKEYTLFINDSYNYRKPHEELIFAKKIMHLWNNLRKAMVEQKITGLKGA